MADKAILTVSVAYGDLIAPLLNLTKKAGRAVVTAAAPISQTEVKLDLFMLAMMRKEPVGCIFGNANPRAYPTDPRSVHEWPSTSRRACHQHLHARRHQSGI